MAIYHFSVQILGRAPGRRNQDGSIRKRGDSAVAAAAYRAGEALVDERVNRVRDYANRAGVIDREIIVPEGAPVWLADRSRLWNEVERLEKRKDAQLAREINVALPFEMNDTERFNLVTSFVKEHFVSKGMVADIAWHGPPEEGDKRNHHAHIMLTLRRATAKGLDPVKTREWNARDNIGKWRKAWQEHANRGLERGGYRDRIDHRTLKAQRGEAEARREHPKAAALDRAPEIHVGPRPKAMQRRGLEPVSKVREVGAFWFRDEPENPARRRMREYPSRDTGPRIGKLYDILTGNNVKAKEGIARMNAYAARFDRWLDHWDRKATWWIDQSFSTPDQRFKRWQAAQNRKIAKAEIAQKAAHAKRRAAQMRALTKALREVAALLGMRQEKVLTRRRQVEGWARPQGRKVDRERAGGRERPSGFASGPSGTTNRNGGGSRRAR